MFESIGLFLLGLALLALGGDSIVKGASGLGRHFGLTPFATGLLVDALLQALRLIVATSNASYGERVTHRLTEILPLDALPRMEAMRAERNVAPPSLSIVA